ncbi:MBL fold metallo-hydrolase [candidate division KSB3 bacterium]|uniref:MBL fold metallo-hydrolase n=1 Tax=candidate division KSB3 bacterium TaxID=2044937 RepID=A0A2G6KIZ2_9BACT|nr:MAG: MBL fold metallo-hydrolase [candidate division KSB3 bacterium]
MKTTLVTDDVYRLSANISSEILFEGIWPLPYGVSMNSYIVKGRECAIIDGVCGWDGVPETLYAQLDEMEMTPQDIRYVILNHLEPDHTGWLESFKALSQDFTVYTSPKGIELAKAFYGIEQEFQAVRSGDVLDLGNGKQLVFEEIPNVHWPETIATFEPASGTLFPCDAFGSFGAVTDTPYDDQLSDENFQLYERETLRYYANIVAKFSASVQKALLKVEKLDVNIIAPAHGIVWRKDPQRIIELYRKYANYAKGKAEPYVTVIWGSMYGNTQHAVEWVVKGLESEGIRTIVHQVPQAHVSEILASAWESTGIVLGMPTYEYNMFAPMANVLDDLGRKRVVKKRAFRFGSYGWSGGAQKELDEIMGRWKMNWDFLDPVEFRGLPRQEDLEKIFAQSARLARDVKQEFQSLSADEVNT